MFGLKIVTKKKMREINRNAENQALYTLITMLKDKDKIFLETVTLHGDNQTITNCAFLGCGGNLVIKDTEGAE